MLFAGTSVIMDARHETFPFSSGSIRRDTMSTISSDKQPSLPSGRWPLTIHGNCARCGHHHKAAMIHIHVVEGICEASHVVCDRCGQKWLTIGGLNNTQISLLSTVTTDLEDVEINFRYTLFSMVRSAASIASPTALANVPEDPPPTPSRSSSPRPARNLSDASANRELGVPQEQHSKPALVSDVVARATRVLNNAPARQNAVPSAPQASVQTLRSIKSKLKNSIGLLKKVRFKAFSRRLKEPRTVSDREVEPPTDDLGVVATVLPGIDSSSHMEDVPDQLVKTTRQVIEELESTDKDVIQQMSPQQRDAWIRERITTFKRSNCCASGQCNCNRRHSASSNGDHYSLTPHLFSSTAPSVQRYSLDQMGSQFDGLGAGALFTHTGPLTISATRISEADTAVENQEGSSSPRSSRLDLAQHARRSRSPRPASLFHSRLSWQNTRHPRAQRDSMDSVLAGTVRTSLRGPDPASLASFTPQDISTGGDALELLHSTDAVLEEELSTASQRSESRL